MTEEDMESGSESDFDAAPPVHPVPTMQGAFEESMNETMNDDEPEVPDRYSKADSVTRRKMLLEQQEYERTVAGRWKQKPGEKFHPLWKLVAQISFGMHLLQQGLAKSDEEVLKILQTHVDEVDGFLERTTEDFHLALNDINERIRYLKLPLEHGQVFDQMLADRPFRVAIVEGNEKIEHIIDRTAAAMNDALKDVQKGLDATRELAKYMTRVDKQWEDRTEEHDSVYLAMIGNTEGWTRAFLTLQSKGGHLRKALVQLGTIVAEMQRRAGAASRKNLAPPSRAVNGRYNVEPRSESPQHTATPPRSPMKTLRTAPDPAARTASSQRYIKTSVNSSAASSPQLEQTRAGLASPAMRHDLALRARSPNPVMPSRSPEPLTPARSQQPGLSTKTSQTLRAVRSPEPTRMTRSPEPMRSAKSPEPVRSARSPAPGLSTKISQTLRPVRSPEPNRAVRSSEPVRSAQTPSPAPSDQLQSEIEKAEPRAKSPDAEVRFKTSTQAMAGMAEGSRPPVPERSASRRRSITEQARSLLRIKPSFQQNDENALSSTNLPIQSPSGEPTPTNRPSSPTVARSLSTRKAQTMSMSTYSASPTSPTKIRDFPPDRGASPVYTRAENNVPTQSSYEVLAFPAHSRTTSLDRAMSTGSAWLAGHSRTSSLDSSVPTDPTTQTKSHARTELPPMARYARPVAALDDSEGNVNTAHPLLQKARHTRFASKNGNDLPLRHYKSQDAFSHSNPDLSERPTEGVVPPKRASSLLYSPNTRSITPTFSGARTAMSSPHPNRSLSHETKRSPTPNQLHQNDSAISLVIRAHTAPAESDLGIHPAHRTPEPPSASTATSSLSPSTTSSRAEQGATPPPIATVRSPKASDATITSPRVPPPSRFAPAAPSQLQNITAPTTNNHTQEVSKDYPPESNPKYKTTATNNTPFYLNPASSQALLDFLASTPPPSPPHAGTKTEPGTPATASTGGFFNRTYISTENRGGESSPPPPFAVGRERGSMDALPRAKTGDGITREKKRWKKIFGGGGKTEKQTNGGSGSKEMKQKKKRDYRKNAELSQVYGVGTGAQSVDGRIGDAGKDGGGYMGLGKDGVWISKKNFVKT
ncbi:MAG: hypothetical protein ALECFALPRED_000137 [Alectoria fallacina]|uniref:Uncharacterized protein n=1 Tax=Alectoria fallacina TaxID=1903189 RepID=A0A8H3EED8_9LECA|nr:MAG: hypothetical protein ALECFALPRED_000137 [Alectoria fallacina]